MILCIDIWREIILYLNQKDVNVLWYSSKRIRKIIEKIELNDDYWRGKLSKRLGFEVFERHENENWKTMYKNTYHKRVIMRQNCLMGSTEMDLRVITNGYAEILKGLIDTEQTRIFNNIFIQQAIEEKQYDIVKMLLRYKKVISNINNSSIFNRLCSENNSRVVEIFLSNPDIDRNADNENPLMTAISCDRLVIVKLLLDDGVIDPSVHQNKYIRRVCRNGFLDMFKLLITDDRTKNWRTDLPDLLTEVKSCYKTWTEYFQRQNYIYSEEEHAKQIKNMNARYDEIIEIIKR